MYEGDVLMEGTLSKQGSGVMKRWAKRYFTLRGHYLKYFKDDRMEDVKGVLDIYEVSECKLEVVDLNTQMITLVLAGGQSLKLQGGTQAATAWVKAIGATIERGQSQSQSGGGDRDGDGDGDGAP